MNEETSQTHGPSLTVPMAIVIAALIIGGAIFFSRGSENSSLAAVEKAQNGDFKNLEINLLPIGEEDHIRGNPNAEIILIEYSDLECPFCKNFHFTMKEVMEQYGKDGSVAWAYRHFPLTQIHPKAVDEAEATECAASLGGNNVFWNYLDKVFETTPSNNGLDLNILPKLAEDVGLNRAAFTACLQSGQFADKIQSDYAGGIDAGVTGTPNSFLSLKNPASEKTEEGLKEINNRLLKNLPAGSPDPLFLSADKKTVSIGGAFPKDILSEIFDLILNNQ
ncbi:MAG: thioredoxin domain-containing protein [bacterium]|nr:thioredoxin domain-containing protein [bacterium]